MLVVAALLTSGTAAAHPIPPRVATAQTGGPQSAPIQSNAETTARRIVEMLSQTVHGTSRATWRDLVPRAAWRDRRGTRDYPPPSVLPQPRGLWCSIATDIGGGLRRDAVFYGLRTELPSDCRLEHVRYMVDAPSDVQGLYDAITNAVRQRFENEFADADPARWPALAVGPEMTGEKGRAPQRWDDVRYWMSGTRYIVLARAGSSVHVMSQSYMLTEALRTDGDPLPDTGPYGVDLLKWEVVNALRPTDPETAELILNNEEATDQSLVERTALRVLQARGQSATEDDRSMLSLASALVVRRLRYQGESWERDRPGLKALLGYGVKMALSPFDDDVWNGAEDFADDVRRRRPGSRWGQLAFVDKLAAGWTEFPGGDQYRHVIAQGTAWLEQHPRSPFAVRVMSHVARAYETWWSLSLAPEDEELVTASDHKDGAEEARRAAVRWYERILREAPTSVEARHARRVLVQITVGVDTGERGFYAVYP